jgi:formiminotetrahydrofolate cyclodeaminase
VDYNDVLRATFVTFGHVMKSPSMPKETTTTLKARHKQIK